METYVRLSVQCFESSRLLVQKISSGSSELGDSSLDAVMQIAGYRSAMSLAAIFTDDSLAEYFEGLEEPEKHGDKIHFRYTCGPEGLAFGGLLVQALISHCSAIELEFDHDEDPPDESDYPFEWPLRLCWDHLRNSLVEASTGRAVRIWEGDLDFVPEGAVDGPMLPDSALESLRSIIRDELGRSGTGPADLLFAFERMVPELVKLENRFRSGNEMSDENSEEFRSLREGHMDFLSSRDFEPYFLAHLKDTLKKMLEGAGLGTLIKSYDVAFYLCSGLIGFLDAGGGDAIRNSFKSYSDFECWREHFLEQLCEDDAE